MCADSHTAQRFSMDGSAGTSAGTSAEYSTESIQQEPPRCYAALQAGADALWDWE